MMATIREMLAVATERLRTTSATARLDAELLLAHLLGWTRAKLLAEGAAPLAPEQAAHFAELVARRAALEPVAYIVGRREFYGLELLVDQRVLIPRPETELLVELALARAHRYPDPQITIADICTGSGAIALALATHLPEAQIVATDIAPEALEVAAQNLERHGLAERVELLQGDLLDALPKVVDIIVCNPPYTILSDVEEGVFRYEPHLALDGGADGLEPYRRIVAQLPGRLRSGGTLLLEIGATQAAAVAALLSAALPHAPLEVWRDLAGHERVVSCQL